jgi:hypothetical protein
MAAAADTPIIARFISSSSSDPLMAAWLSPPTQVSHFQGNLPNFQQGVRHVNRRQRPTRSRAARRSAATNRSSQSMVSISSMRGA